jgi:tRNA threonylcarbamoyladenosine biosynthesis protein TsaB
MLILGIESATPIASVALVNEKGFLGEITLNIGLTHSEQLLPMLDQLLQQARLTIKDVTGLAVSAGPGSFTGLRIGMATAKGLAQGCRIPLLAIPTLETMAWLQRGRPGLISPMQNARRNQVYAALYRWKCTGQDCYQDYFLEEVIAAEAVAAQEWADRLKAYEEPVTLAGDGALIYAETWRDNLKEQAQILPGYAGMPRGGYVALAARQHFLAGETQDLYNMRPLYIRGI